jgi:D-alanyl-D-alanine carboxypeptidase
MFQRLLLGAALLGLSFSIGCSGTDQVQTDSGAPPLLTINDVMAKPLYRSAIWGLRVVDLDTGQVLLDQQPDFSFFIGSVRKIFSVGLLLNQVGANHTYDTPVFRQGVVDAGGFLNGNLVLVASGDLTMGGRQNADGSLAVTDYDHNEANSLGNAVLSSPDPLAGYKDLARQVANSGIKRVSNVVIDDRLFQPFNFRNEFDVKPIFVNDDVVDVSLSPTSAGNLATMEVRPQSAALAIVNSLQTGAAGSAFQVVLDPEEPPNIGVPGASAQVKGTLPLDFKPPFTGVFPLVRAFRITNPSNYARTVFIEALQARGVVVDAAVVAENPVGVLPAKDSYLAADRVALLVGTPYGELARFILKVSYNLGADTSLMLYGLTQGVDSLTDALAQERQVLTTSFGLDGSKFQFVDGSGGGNTKSTNSVVTTMLIKIAQGPTFSTFLKGLPILATDGSLGFVTDFKADPTLAGAAGRVQGKTGTFVELGDSGGLVLRGQALAGYVNTRQGHRLAFQLVVNNVELSGFDDIIQAFQDEGRISAILWRDF